ncbi:hypothetical protein SDC9_165929 [bioreactor metagenome]|uniref:N-acetyltransferase domain-containing protein n=1 Tax=bioreactor metagenome TaxID=1076179 RepID=A0A645FY69_9ZZZZ
MKLSSKKKKSPDILRQSLTIRPAEPADAGRVAEIHIDSWEAAYAEILPESAIAKASTRRPAMWLEKLSAEMDDETIYLAVLDGETVGFSGLGKCRDEDVPPETGEIRGFYLHPDYWRRGIGSRLLKYSLEELKKRSFRKVVLWVLENNTPARKFYERNGLSFDGTRKQIVIGNPVAEVRYSMELC